MIAADYAKGRFVAFSSLPAANDGLVWVLLTGTETDANLRVCASLAAVIATGVNEATFTGYSRQAGAGIAITVDTTLHEVRVDINDPTWTPLGVQALTRIGLFYDPDTTGGTDADLVPIFIDDFPRTTAIGIAIAYNVNAAGFGRAA